MFSEKERAVRRIVLSTPITNAGYLGIKTAAIAAAFVLTAGLMVAGSFVFYGRQFGFFAFGDFLHPLVVFLLPPAVFILGLSLAAGHCSPGSFMAWSRWSSSPAWPTWAFPPGWTSAATTSWSSYPKILMRTLGTGEMIYYLPTNFLISRVGLVLAGIALLGWAATRRCR